jgi:diguanylate cyclase (GGDEF)-like protein
LAAIEPVVTSIYRIAVGKGGLVGGGSRVTRLQGLMVVHALALSGVLGKIGLADAARAASARTQTKLGAAAAMLLLLIAFAYFYLRSSSAREAVQRLAREKEALLRASRVEARTDALTHLGNRRALASNLTSAFAAPRESRELLFAMFDLDGFKLYNDTFGHLAGDALLQRLGGRLAATTQPSGAAYRMGGDEFCVLARVSAESAEQLLNDTVAALQDDGDGWHVGCSHGAVWIPSEAATESQVLKLADERMYANKTNRSSASQQISDVLLQVITEQSIPLDDHVERVSQLAGAIAETLGEPEHEVARIRLAARLHDVGKTAIPAAILDKPGPLDEREWKFVHRHPPDRRAHRAGRPRPRKHRAANPLQPRASRRPWIPRRAHGRKHPPRLAHHRRLRRLRCDDIRPALPTIDRRGRRPRRAHAPRRQPIRRQSRRGILSRHHAAPQAAGDSRAHRQRINAGSIPVCKPRSRQR